MLEQCCNLSKQCRNNDVSNAVLHQKSLLQIIPFNITLKEVYKILWWLHLYLAEPPPQEKITDSHFWIF